MPHRLMIHNDNDNDNHKSITQYIASPARTLFSLKLSMCYYVIVLRWAGPLVEILLRATKISPCQIIKLQCHFRHEPRL